MTFTLYLKKQKKKTEVSRYIEILIFWKQAKKRHFHDIYGWVMNSEWL